jgi:hypothetical protein
LAEAVAEISGAGRDDSADGTIAVANSPDPLQKKFERNKRALGRDGGGLD